MVKLLKITGQVCECSDKVRKYLFWVQNSIRDLLYGGGQGGRRRLIRLCPQFSILECIAHNFVGFMSRIIVCFEEIS